MMLVDAYEIAEDMLDEIFVDGTRAVVLLFLLLLFCCEANVIEVAFTSGDGLERDLLLVSGFVG
jgi:hypothetical protein